jgi:RHS repeat-associated protein
MIVDQTGTLANTKRHDYLPFGEELLAPAGGRNAALGYTSDDGVRQQFTSKERDVETGLDYFGARYFTSTQGRFTSADPLLASARTGTPQSWNRFSYVLNNPLKLIDPTGLVDDNPQKKKDEQPPLSPQAPPPAQQPNPAQSAPATQATSPQTPTSVTSEVPPPDTLVNIPFNGNYINGVGSIIRFTIRDQNDDPIPNVTVLESVTPRTTIQNPNFVTFPEGVVTDLVGRGTETSQPLTRQQAGQVIVPLLATPTPPVVQNHMMIIMSPSGGSAIATHQRSYTNLDAQGSLRPFVNPQTGRSMSNFRITVSPVTVVRMPTVMCPRF